MSAPPELNTWADVLDESCRPFIWRYDDPLFPRLYAWFPDAGSAAWWYSKDGAGWFQSCAGSGDVDSSTISHGEQERGRYRFCCLTRMPAQEE